MLALPTPDTSHFFIIKAWGSQRWHEHCIFTKKGLYLVLNIWETFIILNVRIFRLTSILYPIKAWSSFQPLAICQRNVCIFPSCLIPYCKLSKLVCNCTDTWSTVFDVVKQKTNKKSNNNKQKMLKHPFCTLAHLLSVFFCPLSSVL